MINVLDVSQTQRERLAFLELRAFFTGKLRRSDIESRFGVKPAAASRDISLYREITPKNLNYDAAARCYRPARNFIPVHEFHSERVLTWLLQGFGDGLDLGLGRAAPCEGPGRIIWPDMGVLGAITRAICARSAVRLNYLSLSTEPQKLEILPLALADNGLRWHVRSFDRTRNEFSDFMLTRISNLEEIEGEGQVHELLPEDEQWVRIVELELAPHPGLKHSKAIEADYQMRDGALRLKVRAALAGYVLRRWWVDSTLDHRLDPTSHHLWLRNPEALHGVHSAALAPGRECATNTQAKATA